MPYIWLEQTEDKAQSTLELWPHRSLPPQGFAAFILTTFILITLPLYALLGTKLFWALLPFLMLTVWAIWWALRRNYFDSQILEQLSFTADNLRLVRQEPKGEIKSWECNGYWAQVHLYGTEGPLPNYVTLSGNGREVEIGAFLSEDERKSLFKELKSALANYHNPERNAPNPV